MDRNKTVYFIYCRRLECKPFDDTSIQVINNDNNTLIETVPNFVMNTISVVSHKPKPIRLVSKCTSCGKNTSIYYYN